MEFRILGPLEVVRGSRSLELGGPKQRAVLAALLVDANRVVPLDRILDQLWGEEPPARATASLQTYVSNLRRILEPDRRPRAPSRVLLTQPPGYILRVDDDQADFLRFEALAAKGRVLLAEARMRPARENFANALGLWRGPTLADLSDESFAQTISARLDEVRLSAVEGLMDADLALGQHAVAVPELERLVKEHPYRERLWELLMLALYRCGRQADALQAMQNARAILSEELGIDPGPRLQELEGEILRQSPSLSWKPPPAEPVSEPDVSTAPAPARPPAPRPALGIGQLPLVGRDEELAGLEHLFEEVRQGHGRLLLLSGEAGVGKTRLVEEWAARITAYQGVRVTWGRCHEGEGTPAFWPWVQVFRELKQPSHQAAVSDPQASDLPRLLWGAEPLVGELGDLARSDPAAARARLHDSASRALIDLAATDPLVIVLDDLQWADRPALEFLEFLAPQMAESPLFVIGMHRDAGVTGEDPLAQALGALAREPVIRRLSLTGLSSAEVGALLRDAGGPEMGSELVDAVHRRTDGNPFFVSELIRLLDSEGRLEGATVLERGIPAGVRDVLRRRLARLPEKTVMVLTTASVIGREFEFSLLERVCGLPEESALDHVEAALMTGIITDTEDGMGRYRFSHDLVRESMSAELSAVRRARLHARIATTLEAVHNPEHPDRAVEIAGHMWEGRIHIAPARVVTALMRGAEGALIRLDYDHAQVLLERAVELVEALDRGDERARLERDAQLRLGQLLLMTQGYAAPRTGQAFDAARRAGAPTSEGHEAAVVLFGSFFFAEVRSDIPLALEMADQLLRLGIRTSDPEVQMLGHQAFGLTRWLQGRLHEADEHLSSSMALADRLDRSRAAPLRSDFRVSARCFRSIVITLLGFSEEAERLSTQALALAESLNDPYTSATFYFFDALQAAIVGDVDRAEDRSSAGVELCTSKGYRLFAATCEVFAGWAMAATRDPTTGAKRIRDAREAAESTGAMMLQHFIYALLGDAELRAGRINNALDACEAGLAVSARTGERFFEPELQRLRAEGMLTVSADRRQDAVEAYRLAISGAKELGSRLLESRAEESARRLAVPI